MTPPLPVPRVNDGTLSALTLVYLLIECEKPKGRQKLERVRDRARAEAGRSRVVDFRAGKSPLDMVAAFDGAAALIDLVLTLDAERETGLTLVKRA